MVLKVSNIKVTEKKLVDISGQLKKHYKFLKLTADEEKQIHALTPGGSRSIWFDVTNGNTALCNGWRRVMLDEIEWPRLTCAMEDIKTDDPFCQRMTDYIQNRIWLIPTGYTDKPEQFVLDVKNNTTQPVIVKSSQIKSSNKDSKMKFSQEIDIIELLPGRFIKIVIQVEHGRNLSHASFSNFNGIIYRPLRYNMSDKSTLPASYTVHPEDYQLGFSCEEFVDPTRAAVMGWTVLRDKLIAARDKIVAFREQKEVLPYLSDALNVTQIEGGVIKYEFFGETYTLGNLLSWYAYQEDTTTDFIMAGDDHPEDASILIKIRHKDHSELLVAACNTAVKDVETIIAFF